MKKLAITLAAFMIGLVSYSQVIDRTLTSDYTQVYSVGKYSYPWSCQVVWDTYGHGNALDGTFEIEASNDNVNWQIYDEDFTVTLDTVNYLGNNDFVVSGSDTLCTQSFADDRCEFEYLRFKYTKNNIDTVGLKVYMNTKTSK